MSGNENTINSLVSIFGFSYEIALKAVNSIEDKENIELAWNWILDNEIEEDKGGPVIPTQM